MQTVEYKQQSKKQQISLHKLLELANGRVEMGHGLNMGGSNMGQ